MATKSPNILDLMDELLQVPRSQRARRLSELDATETDRQKIAHWLSNHDSADPFLETPPQVAQEGMRLLTSVHLTSVSTQWDQQSAAALEACVPPALAGYEIKTLLGQGGMASVWRATQLATNRDVALKVMNPMLFASTRGRQRFERELRLTAKLQHPYIARVFEGGVSGGLCYYAMELVEGEPLDQYVKTRNLSQKQIIVLMQQICEAVRHAHQNGVIHRDLKPANILVDLDRNPRVLDFGLAKVLADAGPDASISMDGNLAGTPAFMSPEQAAGSAQVDTRSDVYSLGVVLYRLLTGQPPHDLTGTRVEVLKRISTQEVPHPRKLCSKIDAELETVLLKALSLDPEQRYSSAAEFARDLEHYLRGEPLEAVPPSAMYLMGKFARKYHVAIQVAAAFVLLLVSATIFSTWFALRATRAEASAKSDRDRAVNEKLRADEQAAIAVAVNDFLNRDLLGQASAYRQANSDTIPVHDLKVRDVLDHAASLIHIRFEKQPLVAAAILQTIGEAYIDLGEYDKAESHLTQSLELNQQGGTSQERRTLRVMERLGELYLLEGSFQRSESMLKSVIDRGPKILPPHDPIVLDATNSLAVLYHRKGAYESAEKLFLGVLDELRTAHGEQSYDTLVAMTDLGDFYRQYSRYDKAQPLLFKARDGMVAIEGPHGPTTLTTIGNIAMFYADQRMYDLAEQPMIQVFEERKKLLDEQHPQTRVAQYNLAQLYYQEHKDVDAERLWSKLSQWSMDNPSGLPGTRLTAENILPHLVSCYRRLGRSEEADSWEERLHDIVYPDLERQIEAITFALSNRDRDPKLLADRGRLYARMGRFEEAWADFSQSIAKDPTEPQSWRQGVPLLLALGDLDSFRHYRSEQLKRFKDSTRATAHRVAKGSLVLPLEVDELTLASELAKRAMNSYPVSDLYHQSVGMAEYRSGNYSAAISDLAPAAGDDKPYRAALSDLFLAMAYHQLGQDDNARDALKRGKDTIDNDFPRAGVGDLTEAGFEDWILSHAALREARVLLQN